MTAEIKFAVGDFRGRIQAMTDEAPACLTVAMVPASCQTPFASQNG